MTQVQTTCVSRSDGTSMADISSQTRSTNFNGKGSETSIPWKWIWNGNIIASSPETFPEEGSLERWLKYLFYGRFLMPSSTALTPEVVSETFSETTDTDTNNTTSTDKEIREHFSSTRINWQEQTHGADGRGKNKEKVKEGLKKWSHESSEAKMHQVWKYRYMYMTVLGICFLFSDSLDEKTKQLWDVLRHSAVFKWDSFEPVLATLAFALWGWMFYTIDMKGYWNYYVLSSKPRDFGAHWAGSSPESLVGYLLPLLLFDWIYPRRQLPEESLTFFGLFGSVVMSIFVYDALMFPLHVALHKFKSLRGIHAKHHTHVPLVASEILRHSFIDGSLQVVCNIISLNMLKIHPMARALHNIAVTYMLTEAHSGYDAPWMLHNVVPFGILGGSRRHEVHHRTGKHNFEQLFTWLDNIYGSAIDYQDKDF